MPRIGATESLFNYAFLGQPVRRPHEFTLVEPGTAHRGRCIAGSGHARHGPDRQKPLRGHTERNLDALGEQVVDQSTASIATWLSSRLSTKETVSGAAETVTSDEGIRGLSTTAVDSLDPGNFYVGTAEGVRLMQSREMED